MNCFGAIKNTYIHVSFLNVTDKRRPHEIPSQNTLTLPRNTKKVCVILKMCNANISIIFRPKLLRIDYFCF